MNNRRSLCIILILQALSLACIAQVKTNYFYLSVGCGRYEQDPSKFKSSHFKSFPNIPQAEHSADIMSEVFELFFKARGLCVTSKNGEMIARKDIFKGLNTVTSLIKETKAENPFLLIYLCGHGFLDTVTRQQILVPGDFTRDTKIDFNGGKVLEELIHCSELIDSLGMLKKRGPDFPYTVLYDACRYNEDGFALDMNKVKQKSDSIFFYQMAGIVKQILGARKQQENANFIYGVAEGNEVPTYPAPKTRNSLKSLRPGNNVGSLCRRSLLIFDRKNAGRPVTLLQFFNLLSSAELDNLTPAAYLDLVNEKEMSKYAIN
jgi:hypothetical protein